MEQKHQLKEGMWCNTTDGYYYSIRKAIKDADIRFRYSPLLNAGWLGGFLVYVDGAVCIDQDGLLVAENEITPSEFLARIKGEYIENETTPPSDPHEAAINPSHYKDIGIEPLEVIRRYKHNWDNTLEPASFANIIKYIMRSPFKGNKIQDLKKARVYLTEWIDYLESSSKTVK